MTVSHCALVWSHRQHVLYLVPSTPILHCIYQDIYVTYTDKTKTMKVSNDLSTLSFVQDFLHSNSHSVMMEDESLEQTSFKTYWWPNMTNIRTILIKRALFVRREEIQIENYIPKFHILGFANRKSHTWIKTVFLMWNLKYCASCIHT